MPLSIMLRSVTIEDAERGSTYNVPWMQHPTCCIRVVKEANVWRAWLVHSKQRIPSLKKSRPRDRLIFAGGAASTMFVWIILQALVNAVVTLAK